MVVIGINMNREKRFVVGGLLLIGSIAIALKSGGKPDSSQFPGVLRVVRDGTRPQPRKVETKGAVSIRALDDALFHNGVLLHKAKEYDGPTSHKKLASFPKSHPEKGPIRLQWHGEPIHFRKIWIREVINHDLDSNRNYEIENNSGRLARFHVESARRKVTSCCENVSLL